MNITSCPNCGGKVEPESIGWKCEKCLGFIDMCGIFHGSTKNPFILPPTNADRIRAMSDEEVAEYGVHRCIPAGCVTPAWYGHFKGYADTKEEAIRREIDWLTQTAQEG